MLLWNFKQRRAIWVLFGFYTGAECKQRMAERYNLNVCLYWKKKIIVICQPVTNDLIPFNKKQI